MIDQWAQCDKCKIWRKTENQIEEKQGFSCKNVSKKCNSKEKIEKDYITLQ